MAEENGDIKEDVDDKDLQLQIDKLNKEKELLLKKRKLEEKRQELEEEKEDIKEDIDSLRGGMKPVTKDSSVFWNVLLMIVLVLLAGGLIAEGRLMGRYAVLLLIPIAILIFKVLDKFKNK